MRVLLFHVDGKLPNLALMRIAAHHSGDEVVLHRPGRSPQRDIWNWDRVYASCIFLRSRAVAQAIKSEFPEALMGGTGWDVSSTLETLGIVDTALDYSIYPDYRHSIGFTQRGCRLRCSFCVVPQKEGPVREERTIWQIWRGDPWPRNILLLDNDFFGQRNWQARIAEIREGGFRVSFNQGINARMLSDEAAEAIASVPCFDDDFKARRIYTAWDNRKDEERLFRGLNALVRYGVKPDQIMVYMLIGYWPGETHEDREHRRKRLRDFGCRPYPMPYRRTPELIAYQRWVVRRADLICPWADYAAANFRPERVRLQSQSLPILEPVS